MNKVFQSKVKTWLGELNQSFTCCGTGEKAINAWRIVASLVCSFQILDAKHQGE